METVQNMRHVDETRMPRRRPRSLVLLSVVLVVLLPLVSFASVSGAFAPSASSSASTSVDSDARVSSLHTTRPSSFASHTRIYRVEAVVWHGGEEELVREGNDEETQQNNQQWRTVQQAGQS